MRLMILNNFTWNGMSDVLDDDDHGQIPNIKHKMAAK